VTPPLPDHRSTARGPAVPAQSRYDRRRFLRLVGTAVGSTLLLGVKQCQSPAPFVVGGTRPTAANTGLEAATRSTSAGAPITFSASNQVITNVRFERFVRVTGRNVTFRNCEFVGPPGRPSAYSDLLNATAPGVSSLRLVRCRFRPQTPSPHHDMCVRGHDFVLHRCDLSGTIDGVAVHASPSTSTTLAANVVIEGCYFHDWLYWCPCAATSDNRTHNDCIQLHHASGHRNVTIRGNTLLGFIDTRISSYRPPTFANGVQTGGYHFYGERDRAGRPARWTSASCIMLSPKGTQAGSVLIQSNWIDGSTNKISVPAWGSGDRFLSPGFRVLGNRFGRNSRGGSLGTPRFTYAGNIAKRRSCPMVISGNVHGDGTPYDSFTSLGA
jgi:hypothetical protein